MVYCWSSALLVVRVLSILDRYGKRGGNEDAFLFMLVDPSKKSLLSGPTLADTKLPRVVAAVFVAQFGDRSPGF